MSHDQSCLVSRNEALDEARQLELRTRFRGIASFIDDARGTAAIMAGFALPALIFGVGAVID